MLIIDATLLCKSMSVLHRKLTKHRTEAPLSLNKLMDNPTQFAERRYPYINPKANHRCCALAR